MIRKSPRGCHFACSGTPGIVRPFTTSAATPSSLRESWRGLGDSERRTPPTLPKPPYGLLRLAGSQILMPPSTGPPLGCDHIILRLPYINLIRNPKAPKPALRCPPSMGPPEGCLHSRRSCGCHGSHSPATPSSVWAATPPRPCEWLPPRRGTGAAANLRFPQMRGFFFPKKPRGLGSRVVWVGSEDCLIDGRRLVAKSSVCAQWTGGWLRGWGSGSGARTVCELQGWVVCGRGEDGCWEGVRTCEGDRERGRFVDA